MSLALAREKAADNRAAIAEGRDPVAEKHSPAMPTFRQAAQAVHEANKPRWHNARHTASWIQTLERHAMPKLGKRANSWLNPVGKRAILGIVASD